MMHFNNSIIHFVSCPCGYLLVFCKYCPMKEIPSLLPTLACLCFITYIHKASISFVEVGAIKLPPAKFERDFVVSVTQFLIILVLTVGALVWENLGKT